MGLYDWKYEDSIDLLVTIDWSKPITHDVLSYGLEEADESAYYYSIVAMFNNEWWPYYIGMVFEQNVSSRQKNADHKKKLEELKEKYPDKTWHITLGTPEFNNKNITKSLIEEIEGLLIYSNWHEEILNIEKIQYFNSKKSIKVENKGFTDPFHENIGYGVFYN